MPARRTLAIVALLAASALCVATLEIRTHETGDAYYRFLVWNLILAWVPLVLAMVPPRTAPYNDPRLALLGDGG